MRKQMPQKRTRPGARPRLLCIVRRPDYQPLTRRFASAAFLFLQIPMKRIFYLLLALLGAAALAGPPAARAQDLATIGQQKPVTLTGSLDLRTVLYDYSGSITARRKPFSYVLSGRPTLNIYGMAVPLEFVLSEQDRAVRQPFNQFGVSPTYKWITAHAGYRNISFSPFTLASIR